MSIKNLLFQHNVTDDDFETCRFILDHAGIKHSNIYLEELLSEHQSPTSLLAVKDCLSEYGIESAAVNKGNHAYLDFELPFICVIQQADWPKAAFSVVTEISSETVEYLDPQTRRIASMTLTNFETIDKGVLMLFDASASRDEKNLKQNLVREKHRSLMSQIPTVLGVIIMILCGIYIVNTFADSVRWTRLSFLLMTALGAGISSLLIWHEVDKDNKLIKQVCGDGTAKVNCNAVLSSPQSTVFGISWSMWGGAYFFTVLALQLLFVNDLSFLLITAYSSLAVVPYISYSVYVQWRVIKQWCILCLAIQGILLINAGIAYFVLKYSANSSGMFSTYAFMVTLMLGCFIFFIVITIVPILKSARDSKTFEKKLLAIKSDFGVFDYFLTKSAPVGQAYDNLGIILGNPSGKNEIIKVCNPYCGPCSALHPKLEHLMNNNPDLKVRVIFTASSEVDDIKRRPVTLFLALQQEYGDSFTHKALNTWYGMPKKNYESFASNYKVSNAVLHEQNLKIIAMRQWCDSMKIRATPTLFVNGFELPAEYGADDLAKLLMHQ